MRTCKNPCKTTQTHDKTAPLTIAGAVFTGMGMGTKKYTQGLPVSCLTDQTQPFCGAE